MAVKTFSSEILTSSDTNTFLANAGLVYVTSATIGSAVSSVTISSAFNSTYDAYRIVIAGGASSADSNLALQLGASTTGYYSVGALIFYAGAAGFNVGESNAASFSQVSFALLAGGLAGVIDIVNPFLAKYTSFQSMITGGSVAGQRTGVHQVATSYSAFTLTPSSGTLTGGTITVYGHRKG